MYSFIKGIDIFGKQFNFFIEKNQLHKTYIGGVLTLIQIVIFFVTIFFSSQDVINRTHPLTSNDVISLSEYPIFNITKDNFLFGFRIEDSDGNLWDNSQFFSFDVIYHNITITRDDDNSFIQVDKSFNLNFSLCKEKDIRALGIENLLDSKTFYCVEFPDNLTLGGYWDSGSARYIDINLQLCKNLKNMSNCKSVDETQKLLQSQNLYLNLLLTEYFVNFDNFSSPLTTEMTYHYTMIDIMSAKKQNLYIKSGKLLSDNGYIGSNLKNYSSLSIDSYSFDFLNNKNYDRYIIRSRLYFNKKFELFKRFYIKIQQITSQIITTNNVAFMLLKIFAFYYNDLIFKNTLINEIIDLSPLDFETKDLLEMKNSEIRKNLILNFNNEKDKTNKKIEESKRVINIDEEKIEKMSKTKVFSQNLANINNLEPNYALPSNIYDKALSSSSSSHRYELSGILKLKLICCKFLFSKRERLQYNFFLKAREIIDDQIDIFNILKNIKKLNDMLKILLNPIQVKCLDYIQKPMIDMNNKELSLNFKIKDEKKDKNNKLQIIDYFIKLNNQMNLQDRIIFKNLENDLKLIIYSLEKNNQS